MEGAEEEREKGGRHRGGEMRERERGLGNLNPRGGKSEIKGANLNAKA